ncbi:MAG TPA: hypothetical protein VG709_06625 [Actinomycetota bacterium]|nr:hypothetical protein [Actinomycetota bacterium]
MRGNERTPMRIACDECAWEGTDRCGDCVVSFIVDREDEDPVVGDADEARAMRRRGEAGLVPLLRLERREAG